MKVVLLAGGLGTRLAEETQVKPKPMVEIGGQPILWHIMMMYAQHGLTDFIVCLGYKGYLVKEYFANYVMHRSDLVIDLATGAMQQLTNDKLPQWKVTLVDTGAESGTGGRLHRVSHLLPPGETFCMTYGDGLSDVNISASIEFHKKNGLEATMTTVTAPSRFGVTVVENGRVKKFAEKPFGEGGKINGGFFVLEPSVISRVTDDRMAWEAQPLETLAAEGQLGAWRHEGFWHAMDTLRDKNYLESLWQSGNAPWKTWGGNE